MIAKGLTLLDEVSGQARPPEKLDVESIGAPMIIVQAPGLPPHDHKICPLSHLCPFRALGVARFLTSCSRVSPTVEVHGAAASSQSSRIFSSAAPLEPPLDRIFVENSY